MEPATLILLVAAAILAIAALTARLFYARSRQLSEQQRRAAAMEHIAHELLTPLTILSASIEKLRTAAPAHGQEYDLMELNIQRSVHLLQQVYESSGALAARRQLSVSNSDVMRHIRESASSIQPLCESRQIALSVRCVPDSMMGWADNDKLDKIVFTLLSDAVQHSPSGTRVALEATTNPHYDQVIVRISDDGSPRGHTLATDTALQQAQELVRLHGGTLYANSPAGGGNTFVAELPIGKEAFSRQQGNDRQPVHYDIPGGAMLDAPTEGSELQTAMAGADAHRILLVEDNEQLLNLMKQLLQSRYQILTAFNGREALEVVNAHSIELIVSDVVMPVMDGYELTIQLKQDQRFGHLPVILLTTKTQEEDRLKALQAGADDVVNKPFRLKELQLRIDNLIANRQRILSDAATPPGEAERQTERIADTPVSYDEEFLQRAINCINEHITDTEYNREAFAADMGSSVSTLYNKLRALTGKSVTNFSRDIRIKAACRLAKENPDLRVSDIAYRVGYKDPKYFATSFKRVMGMQPKEYFTHMRNDSGSSNEK